MNKIITALLIPAILLFLSAAGSTEIYFSTDDGVGDFLGGVHVYSEETNEMHTLFNSTRDIDAVAYDEKNKKIYFATTYEISRSNLDGTGVEVVLSSTAGYEFIAGVAVDSITGNLYGIDTKGVFVCQTGNGPLSCKNLLSSPGILQGLALDPVNGTLYFTEAFSGTVKRADMDGSNAVELVTGLFRPAGIAIDFESSRLVWVAYWTSTIKSSNLDGTDVKTIASLPLASYPHGIAVQNGRIFWGNTGLKSLQASTTTGKDVQTLYRNAPGGVTDVSVGSADNLRQTRKNDCAGVICAGICVLTPGSYRCVT